MTDPDIIWAMTRLGDVFTPRRPIGTRELLAGRYDLLLKLIQDITSPAQHALLYGDRGVGKSSIARVLALVVEEPRDPNGRRSVFISCDSNDTVGCQRNWTLMRPRKPKRLGVVKAPSEG